MTITDLILPKRGIILPEVPSYIKLDMAFAAGHATQLGDKSRYRSHGTIHGATVADGAHGKCLDFDPNEPSYVEIPASHTQLDFTSKKFSGIARIYLDDLVGGRVAFCRGRANFDGYYWEINTDGRLAFTTSQASALQQSYSAKAEVGTGAWYTIGFSRNGASVIPYKNGVDIHSVAGVHIDPASANRASFIGIYEYTLAYPFDGKIEFLRVFGGIALSASEHLAYHNALA